MLASDEKTAMWEKRFNLQVAATEEALLAKRNADISLREVERLLQETRSEAARAVENSCFTSAASADSSAISDQVGERRSAEGKSDIMRWTFRQDMLLRVTFSMYKLKIRILWAANGSITCFQFLGASRDKGLRGSITCRCAW